MFVKPQIVSTPHMIAPMGEASMQACQAGYQSCPSGFSCSPWGSACVDAPGPGPGQPPNVVLVVIIGGIVGTVVAAK